MELPLSSAFVEWAVAQTRSRTHLTPHPSQGNFSSAKAVDGKSVLKAISFRAPKVRLLRSLSIDGGQAMQVLDFAAFPEPCYDLPIFCANAFSANNRNIVVLDLNPLYDVAVRKDYKEKYYTNLMPLTVKYTELLPWGGKITGESLKFFSPIVIWTTFTSTKLMLDALHSAMRDYYKAWLDLMDQAVEETDSSTILQNRDAQHKYLTWRAEKDPGYPLLKKLFGEKLAEELVRDFLFEGVASLGAKTFLDYFPEYASQDGTVTQKRSVMGKSYATRPWDLNGEFISLEHG